MRSILRFFDKLEDKIRRYLSQRPILYAIVGGFAVVLFWRGVWDFVDRFEFMTPEVSLIISILLMLATGTFVSFFIGSELLISGMRTEKRIDEKTEEEIIKEEIRLDHIDAEIEEIKRQTDRILNKLSKKE